MMSNAREIRPMICYIWVVCTVKADGISNFKSRCPPIYHVSRSYVPTLILTANTLPSGAQLRTNATRPCPAALALLGSEPSIQVRCGLMGI
jgi:hypothetical protein